MNASPKAFLIDLDGVVYRGEDPIPGAREAIAWLRQMGIPFLFVTNTTSRPRSHIVQKLDRMGIQVAEKQILTPVIVGARWLRTHAGGPAAFFVRESTLEDFAGSPRLPESAEEGAAAVVLGDLGEGWDFRTLNRAFRLLMAPPYPPLLALGMTRYWQGPDGLLLDVAPFVKALEHAIGREALVLGKPAPAFFEEALSVLGVPATETLMIGDDIKTDVRGAQQAGLKAALVQTGKFRDADLELGIPPDLLLTGLGELPAWWDESMISG